MSYILSALQKAERDRRQRSNFSLDDVTATEPYHPSPRRSPSRIILLTGLTIFLTLGLGVVLFRWQLQGATDYKVPARIESAPAQPSDPDRPTTSAAADSLPDTLVPEGVIYIEGHPQASRVFIQGRSYVVGDTYQGNILVTAINASSVTLSNGSESRRYAIP